MGGPALEGVLVGLGRCHEMRPLSGVRDGAGVSGSFQTGKVFLYLQLITDQVLIRHHVSYDCIVILGENRDM